MVLFLCLFLTPLKRKELHMKIINGTAASAVIFDTNNEHSIDDYALSQLQNVIGETVVIDKVIKPVYNFKA